LKGAQGGKAVLLAGEELLAEVSGEHGGDAGVGHEEVVARAKLSLGLIRLVVLPQLRDTHNLHTRG
jgi:hypothetical protein